ncbi:MAG: hypothetical protein FGM24_03855 [Candidatus Kapabacteria bacterium]|nr:hypothetical protein [Candidatus Kapabacteria bacterium]
MRAIIGILTFTILSAASAAQVRPSRTWWQPFDHGNTLAGPMASLYGGADVDRTFGSTYDEQAWQFRAHVAVEPYRFTDSTDEVQITTLISSHQELTANPFNDISFNPRTMRWEEFIQVVVGTSTWTGRIGWLHRCKHDLDNLDGPSELDPSFAGQGVQRTIILSGPTLSAGTAPFELFGGRWRIETGVEWFVLAADYRSPAQSVDVGSWKHMQGAVWGRGVAAWYLSTNVRIQTQYYVSAPWFSARLGAPADIPLPHEARAEISLCVNGRTASAELVAHAEHVFDELSFLDARPSTYAGIGLRFAPRW